jgi:hypothetical protein
VGAARVAAAREELLAMCKVYTGFVFKGDLDLEDEGYIEIIIFPTREAAEETLEADEPGDDIVAARIMVEVEGDEPC